MNNLTGTKNRFSVLYEVFIWLTYVCLFKYSFYLQRIKFVNTGHPDFPHPELILYSILITLYVIPFYKWIALRLLRDKKNALLFFIAIIYFSAGCFLFKLLATKLFISLTNLEAIHAQRLYGNEVSFYLTDLVAFSSIAFIRFAFEREERRFQIEKDNSELKLETLKAQINPHFLFNTLNFMYAKALPVSAELSDSIHTLSRIMRYALEIKTDAEGKVFLTEELNHIQNLVKINRYRLGSNMNFKMENYGNIEYVKIPPFVLITLVENIFEHGQLLHNSQPAVVKINYTQDGSFTFETTNPIGISKKLTSHKIGLQNIKERLKLVYGNRAELHINETETEFKVKLTITNI